MEDQIASFKDRVHEKLIGYFKQPQDGNQQKSSLEDETRLILFIYLCFNCLMFTMVSFKIFIYWVGVNVLVFVFLKYFFVEQRPEMTFDSQFGRQARTQTFFEGGYPQEVKVNEIKPKSKPQNSDKNDKESYVLKESKSSVKKRSIYAMDLPAESSHLQTPTNSAKEKSYENIQREQPSFAPKPEEKKNTEPKTSLLLKIRGSISNLKFRIAQKNQQQESKNTKSFFSLFSFARFAKRKEEKESFKADNASASMEIEKEEVQEIPKNKQELLDIPKEKEESKAQQESQEEVMNKRNKSSQDFQNQVIQELMKQMGGKNLSELLAPKQQQQPQQPDINQILNEMESDLFDKKGKIENKTNMTVQDETKLVKEPIKIPKKFANSQRINKGESNENIDKKQSVKIAAGEPLQKPLEAPKSTTTRSKARLAYCDDDSEEEDNQPGVAQNLNETQTESKNYQASFTLGEQNANNESSQAQDSEYESVSFGGPNQEKSKYFACVFADRPERETEVEVETGPENEADVKPAPFGNSFGIQFPENNDTQSWGQNVEGIEHESGSFEGPNQGKSKYFACVFADRPERETEVEVEIGPENEADVKTVPFGNSFGIQFPGNNETQSWSQNVGGLNQASFFNNFGDYFKTDSCIQPQYEENHNQQDTFVVDQNSHQELAENPEENSSIYHQAEISYQNITQNFNDENEEDGSNSLLLVQPKNNKQVNNSFSASGLANNQKKGFLGRRGLASGSSFALGNKNTK